MIVNAQRQDAELARFLREGHGALKDGDDPRAVLCFDAAITRPGGEAEHMVYEGMACALRNQGQIQPAMAWLDAGVRRFPGNASLRLVRALLLLGTGSWGGGWADWEMRFKSPQACFMPRVVNYPRWNGDTRIKGRLLVWGEQGYGDEVMFASLYNELIFRGMALIIECAPQLVPLFKRSFPVAYVSTRLELGKLRDVEAEIPAGSLPALLRPNAKSFERAELPFLVPDPKLVKNIGDLLRLAASGRPIVGVSWQGGTSQTRAAARSLPAAALVESLRALDTSGDELFLISLQHRADVAELYERAPVVPVLHVPDLVGDLNSLAATIANCACVVTVCNTNVHLAGAMGKTCICLAPHAPEWRYQFSGAMPWYQSVDVWRQPKYGDWRPLLEQLAAAVRRVLKQGRNDE